MFSSRCALASSTLPSRKRSFPHRKIYNANVIYSIQKITDFTKKECPPVGGSVFSPKCAFASSTWPSRKASSDRERKALVRMLTSRDSTDCYIDRKKERKKCPPVGGSVFSPRCAFASSTWPSSKDSSDRGKTGKIWSANVTPFISFHN